jgi:hypothetical protein
MTLKHEPFPCRRSTPTTWILSIGSSSAGRRRSTSQPMVQCVGGSGSSYTFRRETGWGLAFGASQASTFEIGQRFSRFGVVHGTILQDPCPWESPHETNHCTHSRLRHLYIRSAHNTIHCTKAPYFCSPSIVEPPHTMFRSTSAQMIATAAMLLVLATGVTHAQNGT